MYQGRKGQSPVVCRQVYSFDDKELMLTEFIHQHSWQSYANSLFSFVCVISIRLSLSNEANKTKFLNIERAYQFQLSLKI